MIEYIGALILAIVLIARAGDVFVDSACRIARALGVSQAVIALTLIALATSAPEFFTSLIAAWQGNVGISYGNVVGSNIVNITPILAIAAISGAATVRKGGMADGVIMLGVGGMLAAMSLNGSIGWAEGILLLVIFVLFLKFVLGREAVRRKNSKIKLSKERESLRRLFALFTLGTAGVVIGSWLLVFGGAGVARTALVAAGLTLLEAEAAIGFTVVAIGTSIPELATVVISVRKRLADISVGTIVGSNIFNGAFIVGSAALATGARGAALGVDRQAIWFSNPMMLISMGLLVWFMRGRKKLARGHGWVLSAFYVFYLVGLASFYIW